MKRQNTDNQKKEARNQSTGSRNQSVRQTGVEDNSNTVKNPDEWTTGDEPMTGAQHSYLKTLSDEAGEELDEKMTKAEASKRIDELQHKTGRGLNNSGRSNA